MLKAKKPKSTKMMSDAVKEVTKEETVGIHFQIPDRLRWKLKAYILHMSKKQKITEVEWFIEQLEALPSYESK